ncbi:MAG: cysteine desulfurase / selenocysteine lyase [Parcubacteria group bacterium Gr01-1014_30]|nr:MAG: cysteine desulfurase / selenocysteine lyase [Parcubacteria group bacterium Gr01-1014_30]
MREDFPIFERKIGGKKLIYFDSASTTQKPKEVIDAVASFYKTANSNVHRGLYFLSREATEIFEATREKIRKFISAEEAREIVFVRGTTEAINLVATTFGKKFVKRGDEILISEMEHHSNIVPWQMVCQDRGAKLKIIPVTDSRELNLQEAEKLITKKTKLVAITHVSNVLGTINPVKEITKLAHKKRVPVLVDGAQAVGHIKVDVRDLDCDFYAFSGHKMYGSTGIGVLFGKKEWLEKLPPYQGGGEMIKQVTFEKTTYNDLPYKFEAGTPDIAGVVGLGAAIDYVTKVGADPIQRHEKELLKYGQEALSSIGGVKIFGRTRNKTGIISFILERVHPHDVGTFLDGEGIAIRTGHHCCQPLMERLGVVGTCRISFGIYNTKQEIDKLKTALLKARDFFHGTN